MNKLYTVTISITMEAESAKEACIQAVNRINKSHYYYVMATITNENTKVSRDINLKDIYEEEQ